MKLKFESNHLLYRANKTYSIRDKTCDNQDKLFLFLLSFINHLINTKRQVKSKADIMFVIIFVSSLFIDCNKNIHTKKKTIAIIFLQ